MKEKIPKKIFQTWKTKTISDEVQYLTNTWRTNNPDYVYHLFDDNDCEEFIKTHFDIKVYQAYCRIFPGAYKADMWRYCVLYIFGGIYIDIDTICFNPIDLVLNEDIEFICPIDLNNSPFLGKYNLFNTFIASVPKHPILLNCINKIVYHIENNIIPFSNLDFSGPGLLGQSTNLYLKLDPDSSFIGKQGYHDNNKIKLLQFECGTEYVKEENLILLQNKNGSEFIKKIYEEEVKNINGVDWGKCENPIKPEPTIVTMIYNIREKENNQSHCIHNHKLEKYLKSGNDFILTLPYPLIIFTDDDDIINCLKEERKKLNLLKKTVIYKMPLEETYFYKDLDLLKELQTKFHIFNGFTDHETPLYIILTNNKMDFIEKSIEYNPFKSTHFVWMDFGINHVAENTNRIHDWIYKIPDKIKQLCINPYLENICYKEMFQNIYHHMAAGLFSGSTQNLLIYSQLFKEKTKLIYQEDWYQLEEAVMTMVQRENPELFDLYYGDYQGIVSNYIHPINNLDLILNGCKKALDNNNVELAYKIGCYCIHYFESNIHNELIYEFFFQHIISDFYFNNKRILDAVVNLMNIKKTFDEAKMRTFFYNNMDNIDFYDNKDNFLFTTK